MAYIPSTGSVVSYQIVPSSLLSGASIYGQLPGGTAMLGSVAAIVSNLPGNYSISGTVGASIIGHAPVFIIGGSVATATTNSSVMLLNGANTIGSVTAIVSNFPITQNVSGSVLSQQLGTYISSTVSANPSSMLVGASIFGQLPAGTATLGSVAAIVSNFPTTQNVSGSVLAQQLGAKITSVISSTPSSMLTGASIFGMLPAGTQVLGSVATLQGTNPWIATFSNSSILAVPVGSVITVFQAPSIVGTYAEDATHTSADKGIFTLGVRNDTVSSYTSANTEYGPIATDSAGRTLIKPFTSEDGTIISYTGSVVSASVTLMQASAIGLRNYLTDFMIVNTGATAQLITFQDGSTSVLGYTIAPAGGGSNAVGWNIPMKTAPSQDLAFKTTGTSSVVYVTAKGYRAQ